MKPFLKILILFMFILSFEYAGDLDDGISKYTDDPISADDQVFKKEVNMAYMKTLSDAQSSRGNTKQNTNKDTNSTDSDGIVRDSKGNMFITRNSKLRSGQTIVNNPKGGKNMEGNMVIDPSVRIPIGTRVINAPKITK